MREILFRAKTIYGNTIFGFPIIFQDNFHMVDIELFKQDRINVMDFVAIKEETLSQFTGLTDKNGKKIFENDLVKVGLKIYEIKWNDDNCRFDFWFKDCYQSGCNKETLKNLEIIGNKFDLEVSDVKD